MSGPHDERVSANDASGFAEGVGGRNIFSPCRMLLNPLNRCDRASRNAWNNVGNSTPTARSTDSTSAILTVDGSSFQATQPSLRTSPALMSNGTTDSPCQ